MNEKITKHKNEILVLNSDRLLKQDELNEIRKSIINQMKDCVVVIPSGFDYAIFDRSVFLISTKNEDEKDVLKEIIEELKSFVEMSRCDAKREGKISKMAFEFHNGKALAYAAAIKIIKRIGGIE